ncbi:MAG: TetR/AcrR family transcriptional regulator [Spirochaetes bacterium]|nr:TetR/AcrR family transcriptional regulator [Spirochaetota bacterium]MBU1079482.1 TetR/AcrR family transcriptional regulator [Spirochaetota bacterium]
MSGVHHTATFDNIPAEKRERILSAVAAALGRDGIAGARMADVAREAGVSHGSLFSYFPTKDDMVRAVVERGMAMQAERFAGSSGAGCFDAQVRSVFRGAWDLASSRPELISLWLSLSLEENSRFADAILPLERDAAERWLSIVERGKAEGAVAAMVDTRAAAYLLDALAAQLMKSRASGLERDKLAAFMGVGPGDSDLGENPAERVAGLALALFRPR